MTTLRRILTGAAITLMATSIAGATTITRQITFSTALTSITASSSPIENFNLGQFNRTAINAAITAACASGHTCTASNLTSIDFQLASTVNTAFITTNSTAGTLRVGVSGPDGFDGSGSLQYSYAVQADLVLFDPNLFSTVETLPTFFNTTSIATAKTSTKTTSGAASDTQTGHINVATGLLTTSVNNIANTATLSGPYTTVGTDLNTYVGAGTVTYELAIAAGYHVPGTTPAGLALNSDATLTSGTATIVYTYTYDDTVTTTPEPTTMVLFGSALLGIGLLRKRSRS